MSELDEQSQTYFMSVGAVEGAVHCFSFKLTVGASLGLTTWDEQKTERLKELPSNIHCSSFSADIFNRLNGASVFLAL